MTAVVVVHAVFITGLYKLFQTEYVQDFIKVSKLTTIQEPVKPVDPPPSEKEPEPEAKPEPKPEPPPMVKKLPPESFAPQTPREDQQDQPAAPPVMGDGPDSAQTGSTAFAIGKGRSRYALYEDLLMGAIQAVYRQPPDLSEALEYAVLCQVVLDDEGYVLSYKLLDSSGSEVFDRSAQQALSRLRQVRPPPEGMSRTIVVKFFPP